MALEKNEIPKRTHLEPTIESLRSHTRRRHVWNTCLSDPYVPTRAGSEQPTLAASLTTLSGRSILGQLMKIADAVIIEDVDLAPEHLVDHQRQFGLAGTAAVHCRQDGFATDANHYVVTTPSVAAKIRGERLW